MLCDIEVIGAFILGFLAGLAVATVCALQAYRDCGQPSNGYRGGPRPKPEDMLPPPPPRKPRT